MVKVTTDAEGMKLMVAAAGHEQLPLELWARVVLLKEARKVAHLIVCRKPRAVKERGYRWLGQPCSREVYEAGMAKKRELEARIAR